MPTIKQLPAAVVVDGTDQLPLSQSGVTRSVTVTELLSGTQTALSLAKGTLLGRVSDGGGGPEAVNLGAGVTITGGALTATGEDHTGFTAATALLAGDEVVINSAAAPRRLPATGLRALFSAGANVTIDTSGVISAAGVAGPQGPVGPAGPAGAAAAATASAIGAVKPGTGLSVAGDGTLNVSFGTSSTTVAAGSAVGAALSAALPSATTAQLYGGSGGAGAAQPVTLGANLSISSGVLSASGGGGSYTGTAPILVSGGAISVAVGSAANTVAAGNDSRITGALSAATAASTYAPIANATFTGTHSIPSGTVVSGTGALVLPQGTAAQQPDAGGAGEVRFNTTTSRYEFGVGGAWVNHARLTAETLLGQHVLAPRVITNTGAVAILPGDGLVKVNKTVGGATAVTLESNPVAGTVHVIKDGKGDAATNNITITAASGTIDGAASFVINQNRGAVTLQFDGSEWSII